MLYKNFAFLAIIFASVSAIPFKAAKRDFINDENGNLKITCKSNSTVLWSNIWTTSNSPKSVSDQKIKLGTITMDEIVDEIAKACHTEGQCDTSPIDIKGYEIRQDLRGDAFPEILTVNPSGSYPTWIHNGLIDALRVAVKAMAECHDVTIQPMCLVPLSFCPCMYISLFLVCSKNQKKNQKKNKYWSCWHFHSFISAEETTKVECTVPQYWGINYQPPDLGNAAPPFIGADMDIAFDDNGACELFTTVGSAIAGRFLFFLFLFLVFSLFPPFPWSLQSIFEKSN